jgi:hypothetical protein
MLAERFMPRLFDQIAFSAAADPKGHCGDLAALEAATAAQPTVEIAGAKKTLAEVDQAGTSKEQPESDLLPQCNHWPANKMAISRER